MIAFINEFHGTAAHRKLADGDLLNRRQVLELRKRLCGSNNCTCRGAGGVRGGRWRLDHWDVELWIVSDTREGSRD